MPFKHEVVGSNPTGPTKLSVDSDFIIFYHNRMKIEEYEAIAKVAERWKVIADRLDNQSVVMTANTHRLFANELMAELSKVDVEQTLKKHWVFRIATIISGS